MPAGMSWSRYLAFLSMATGSTLLGAGVVHNIYKPNLVSYASQEKNLDHKI